MEDLKYDKRLGDRRWRMSHLYKIKDKQGKITTFKMNRAQRHFDKHRHCRNVLCKSRQLGISTYKIIDALDKALFSGRSIKDCVIIAHKEADAKRLFNDKLKFAWEQLPEEIKCLYKLKKDSAQEITFNLGTIEKPFVNSVCIAGNARSGTMHYVHITELSSLDREAPERAKELMAGTVPTVPDDGDLDIESTPRGNTGQFHDIFMGAWKALKRNPDKEFFPKEYKPFFYNWQWDDYELNKITEDHIRHAIAVLPTKMKEYQVEYKLSDKEITFFYFSWLSLNKDWALLRQEFPTTVEEAFLASGDTLFDLDKLAGHVIKTPRRSGNWEYFKECKPKHVYALGCDVSEGIGLDASTIVVYDFTDHLYGGTELPEVVATFVSNDISPMDFAKEVSSGGRLYNGALCAIERNNHGHATIGKLAEIYPKRLIYASEDERLGWISTSRSRPLVLYGLQDALVNDDIILNSGGLISEMTSFPKDRASQIKPKKEDTNHWDLLMAGAIGYHMRHYVQRPKRERRQQKEQKRFCVY